MHKTRVAFLLDPGNTWLEPHIRGFLAEERGRLLRSYAARLVKDPGRVRAFDIVFILGYTRILPPSFLRANILNLVVHESALPKGRGFSPVQWQVLEGARRIPVCLFEATEGCDEGDILLRDEIRLRGHELLPDIRAAQAHATLRLIKRLLRTYPRVRRSPQVGSPSHYRRRNRSDDALPVDLSLRELFPRLRIADNERHPLYFDLKGCRYTLRISREGQSD